MRIESVHPPDERLLLGRARELPPRHQRTFDAHLATCTKCQERIAALRAAELDIASVLGPLTVEDDAAAATRRRLAAALFAAEARAPVSTTFANVVSSARLVAVAAALALCVLVGVRLSWRFSGDADPQSLVAGGVPSLPIASLTPGATTEVAMDLVCSPQEPPPPAVPADMRQRVLRAYAMDHVPHDQFELDYLITPQLGGATHPANLWPERYDSPIWNARVKDQLETLLPALVCAGTVDLVAAQQDIAKDWIAAYKKYFKTDVPLRPGTDASDDDGELAAQPTNREPWPLMTLAAWK